MPLPSVCPPKLSVNQRVCIACRQRHINEMLIRLTVEPTNNHVILNQHSKGKGRINGRSAYFCRSMKCLEVAIKGVYLKHALTGRKEKNGAKRRQICWPLQSQLIKDIINLCKNEEKHAKITRDMET